MNPAEQSQARRAVTSDEQQQIVAIAAQIEQLIAMQLRLRLSGEQVGAIAAAVRTEFRDQVDSMIFQARIAHEATI